MGYQILNIGNEPTFETYRRGKACTSIVDVTACSTPLLGRIKDWQIDSTLTTSDHNSITFSLNMRSGEELESLKPITTRRYNTKKAKWSKFMSTMKRRLSEEKITPDSVRESEGTDTLEEIITSYTKCIHDACAKNIPALGHQKRDPVPSWYTKQLDDLKREVLRKKRRIRNAAPHRVKAVVAEYQQAREEYNEKAEKAQTEGWKQFCTTQDKESMWDKIYRVIRQTSRRKEDMLLRDADGNTLSPQQSAELLARTFYPDDTESTDQPCHSVIREQTGETPSNLPDDDPPFTSAELESVLQTLNPKKAPGPDGLTADICAAAIQSDREVFMAIANTCLSRRYFPKQWKEAHVIILRKPGKVDYTHPKSYRPIGLLSVLGKIVEKLLVGRLQWHLLPTLSPKQYGFTPQRGTEDALYDLVEHIKEGINTKQIVLLISLDIEGAFDNAWWPALKLQLAEKRCPSNLYETVCSYLNDRKIRVNYARAACEKGTTKGCVQGSIGGPTFWNVILDSLLRKLEREKVYCQAFADDVVLVFTGQSVTLAQEANATLDKIVEWGVLNKLNFAPHKTNAMLLTKKLKYDPPELFMSGVRLNLVEEIKLLGLVIDRKLTFKAHVSAQCKKVADIYKQLACAAKVTWGLNSEITRTIYVSVVEPILTYAANVWAQAVDLEMNRSKLLALQRGFAQKICKSYRTVSLTSALALSGLIPIDLRILESASLYKAKKSLSLDYLPPEKELEQNISFLDQPHPSTITSVEYELLETDTSNIPGPHIYTDGSKIEGQVGAALSWWEEGREIKSLTFKLHPECTVFQSELYALYRATQMVQLSKDPLVNILSDSRSSLDLLKNPKTSHPLARGIKESIVEIKAEGRDIRMFWLRAHVGTAGNERADELAKSAAQNSAHQDYDKVPLSYVRKKIREESIRTWQDRYDSSSTGAITRRLLPDVTEAYRLTRTVKLSPLLVQAMTGHGGISEYLYRFKLKDGPGCECDTDTPETVWHIILECPRFSAARQDLETIMQKKLLEQDLHNILAEPENRKHFLAFVERSFRTAVSRNSTLPPITTATTTPQPPQPAPPITQTHKQTPTHTEISRLLAYGEQGEPGIHIRGVALFMDSNRERFGVSFCLTGASEATKRVRLSPGIACLLNGSSFKTTMKRRTYNAMPATVVMGCPVRLVRLKNKTVALVEWTDQTPFALASSLLSKMAECTESARVISVDAMVIEHSKGEIADHIGCIKASEHHEVIVYEDRGDNLSYLRKPVHNHATDCWGHPIPTSTTKSGSERLQDRIEAEKSQEHSPSKIKGRISTFLAAFSAAARSLLRKPPPTHTNTKPTKAPATRITEKKRARTRADKGQVSPPQYIPAQEPSSHAANAFFEFLAVTRATREVNLRTCENILQSYRREREGSILESRLLKERLEDADAAIYNNDTSQVIKGTMSGQYMAAYNATDGFVFLTKDETGHVGRPKYATPQNDPIVVTARCTKIMLDDRVLEMANAISGDSEIEDFWRHWEVPKIQWVNGVPGCGKTTWVVRHFDVDKDVIVTTTKEAAEDLKTKLAHRIGNLVKTRVRTMASVLVNGFKKSESYSRLMVDEALMNHFGAIVMAARLSRASELVLIGDVNQLPYIDRENLFEMRYNRPNLVTNISQELLCTHRNPMDVAYALRELYSGIYSSAPRIESLHMESYTGAEIPKSSPNTLFLVHTQEEKETLNNQGYGEGMGSRILTIHEAQGLTYESVIAIKTKSKLKLHESVPHAVVAISRHTGTFKYYADDEDDAIGRFVRQAMVVNIKTILDYNLKMAIRDRNCVVMEALLRREEGA